jgi:hypothetical protein
MTSPNFSQYVDLTIYDIDAFQVYDDAIVYARDAVPEFEPRPGTLEEAILQAISYNTALLSSQINRLPDGLMEGITRLAGLERREATFATGTAIFEIFDDNGITIPAGTIIAYEEINDDVVTSFPFETVTDLVIPAEQEFGTVAIRATDAGVYPALLGTQQMELISPAPGVVDVVLGESIFVGTNEETDLDYFNRATQHFASLSMALVTKSQILNYIKSQFPFVGAVAVFDLTDSGETLLWADAPTPGYVTIVLSNTSGEALGTTLNTEVMDDISSKTVGGLVLGSVAPVPVQIFCVVDIVVSSGFTSLEVRTAIEEYLEGRLSAVGYDFSGIIIKNELISGISNISGVRYVKSLILDHGDILRADIDADGNITFLHKNSVPLGDIEVTSS